MPRLDLAPAAIRSVLRDDPDPERRAATVEFLGWVRVPGRMGLVLSVFEDPRESGYVRGRAAEALVRIGQTSAVDALVGGFKDPDPVVRFWSVFAVGGLARYRPHLHARARQALRPMVSDKGDVPGYWPVGHEALAMLEPLDPTMREHGQRERMAIVEDADAPANLKWWASFYSDDDRSIYGTGDGRIRVAVRYRGLCWTGWR